MRYHSPLFFNGHAWLQRFFKDRERNSLLWLKRVPGSPRWYLIEYLGSKMESEYVSSFKTLQAQESSFTFKNVWNLKSFSITAKNKIYRVYFVQYAIMSVCLFVHFVLAQPLNIELLNFGIMWVSSLFKYLKKIFV